jgi:hypothetical protein
MFKPTMPYDSEEAREAENQRAMAAQGAPAGPGDVDPQEGAEGPEGEYGQPGASLVPRDPEIPQQEGEYESADKITLFEGGKLEAADAPQTEEVRARHRVLMDCLDEEGDRQAEERQQAQIDDDYYHHLQWTAEQARVLANRGQAPLVFNESRATIDWLCGTERRLRKDYKIRPRSKEDEAGAESKTKAFKYLEDVNLAPWHRSKAAKQMFTSGLGWLEEGINTDPELELVYSGSEDWRRIFRDSRAREFDLADCRYIHRRKILDLDYATAILPHAAQHLAAMAGRWGTSDEDEQSDIWYLGERLTNANTQQWAAGQSLGLFGDAYTVRMAGSGIYDHGRRRSVEIIESWYRVPERVKVFAGGPLFRKVFNPMDPRHLQLQQDRHPMYEAVKWCMRVMVSTTMMPCWDGKSPYTHGKYPFIPMWGYRRGRDGLTYGPMRGMRDAQDDLNKRRSKALLMLSSNRVVIKRGTYDDIEELREEAARSDGIFVVDNPATDIKFEKFPGEVEQNMELAEADRQHIRNAGGVTGDNLGQESNAISGKAIIAKQEQGSLTSFELFDNYLLAFKLAGQIRLAHIEQFCNQEWQFRLDPSTGPAEWVTVNKFNPLTGQYMNDITAGNADFIVDQQDYRATLTQAAMQSMFELLTQIATFAPNVVMNLLDLVVDSADISGKDVWVQRIRAITGMRDPSKPPTPEEQAADQKNAAEQEQMKALTMAQAQAQVDVLRSKINDTNAAKVLKNLQGLLAAIEAAATVATMPGVAAAADGLAKASGFEDQTPGDGVVVATPSTMSAQPQPALPAPADAQPPMAPQGDTGQPAMTNAMSGTGT